MRASRQLKRILSQLAACALAACTSEARLGYWSAAPLASQDAAATPDGPDAELLTPDGGFIHASPLCLRNPSLDGITWVTTADPGTWWPAEQWDPCFNDPVDFPDPSMPGAQLHLCAVTLVSDATALNIEEGAPAQAGLLPPPTHGVGYLMFDNLRGLPERTSQAMCGELMAGFTYNFAIDLASRVGQTHDGQVLGPGVLEIYGGDVACSHALQPLWRSPPLTAEWQTYCVSVTPDQTVSVLTLEMPAKDVARSAVLADNIRLSDSCGPAVVPPP